LHECAIVQSLNALCAMLNDAGSYFGTFYYYWNYVKSIHFNTFS